MNTNLLRTTLFWTLMLLLAGALHVQANDDEQYTVTHYSIEDGLSQNTVMSILQDKQGYMWFGTWDGLNRFDGYTFTVYKAPSDSTAGENAMVNNRVDLLYEDASEQIWWRTYDGQFYRLDRNRTHISHILPDSLPDDVRTVATKQQDTIRVDSRGIIWQVDDKPGILRCRNGIWKRLQPTLDPRYAGQLRRNFIMLEDVRGRVWVNPTGGGFGYYDPERDEIVSPFYRVTNMIHTAYVDRNGRMWFATYDKGVDCVDIGSYPYHLHDLRSGDKNGEVRAIGETPDGQLLTIVKDERRIYCIANTRYGMLYGTKGRGILRAEGKTAPKEFPVNCPDVYDIVEGPDGTLYVATYGGGVNVLKPAGNGKWEPNIIGYGYKVRSILLDGDVLWAATATGLLRADLTSGRKVFTNCYDIRCMYLTDSLLWLGTFGGGLNYINPAEGERIRIRSIHTNSDIILSMMGEGEYLWYTSESGITRMRLSDHDYQYFSALDSDPNAYFTEAEAFATHDGRLIFGYSNGYCELAPDRVTRLSEVPPLYITNCSANGESASVSSITMEPGDGTFTVNYAALEYTAPHRILYAYKLDGVDNDWHYVGEQRQVTYTNLHPGHYTFRVRSTNREGVWVENECALPVTIEQSPWLSLWAILIYILVALTVIYIVFRLLKKYEKLNQELEIEQKVTDIKLRFFTNISHELRTPLTLISGPIENILQTEKISPSVRSQLEIVRSNNQRMLRLVNELLDFRKIQNQKMRLRIRCTLLSELVNETVSNFEKEANDKHVMLHVENNVTNSLVWVDRERVGTILYNLLSNAFKFTPAGKSITVSIDEKPGFVLLSVKDEGVGIPNDKRSVLFERFSSHNEVNSNSAKTGTGIGLNLVKELVDLHHGYIEVDSTVGQGTTFTIMFPTGKEHYGNEVDIVVDDNVDPKVMAEVAGHDLPELPNDTPKSHKILIVEDNSDMRNFLTSILGVEHEVVCAEDGQQALDKIHQDLPDLIVTDLMMPNMDGLELTRAVKKAPETAYIPVILLTAKSAIESRLEAMEDGADDYVTKPFEPEFLRARVRNLLAQRAALEASYRERLLHLEIPRADETMPNDAFLAKLLNVMEKEMDNNELTVDQLVSAMNMGRTVFFNKLKSMTGFSPVEFIREMRIKRAAQLLEQGSYNIAEVTYMVGMNDSRYFSKCFKNTYGVTPTEYRRKKIEPQPE